VLAADDPLRVRLDHGIVNLVTQPAERFSTGGVQVPVQVSTIGPAHLSLADRGPTFATNPDAGLCLRFPEPVAGIDPRPGPTCPGPAISGPTGAWPCRSHSRSWNSIPGPARSPGILSGAVDSAGDSSLQTKGPGHK
jgi:hypothetical protein